MSTSPAGAPIAPALPVRRPAVAALIEAVARRIDERSERMSRDLSELVALRMPELAAQPDDAADLVAASRGVITLITAMARSWTDPATVAVPADALAWARSLVEHGLQTDTLLRVFRLGQAQYQAVWHEELATCGAPQADILETLAVMTEFTFAWVDAISAPLVAAHDEERERRLRGVDAVRTAELDRVLSGEPLDVRAASARLGYELGREHVGLLLWVDADIDERRQHALEALMAESAELLVGEARGRPLVVRLSPTLIRAWAPGPVAADGPAAAVRRLASTGVRLAVGGPGAGVDGFRRTADEARRARRVTRLLRTERTVTLFEEVAVADLLTRDVDAARAFARRELGPLAADTAPARRLLGTLSAYFARSDSFARTARHLGVHPNTVAYRVRRAAELAGHGDPASRRLRAAVELAPLVLAPDPSVPGTRAGAAAR